MKAKSLLLLCLLGFNLSAQVNDPFDKSRRNAAAQEVHPQEDSAIAQGCLPELHVIAAEIPFNRLKIIGLLQYKEQAQLLLSDGQQVFQAVIGDVIGQERLKVRQIRKQNIQLNQLRRDCTDGDVVSIKF